MASFSLVRREDAPVPPKRGRLWKRMREYEEYLGTLTEKDVGCLVPGAGETTRGLQLRIRRAGTRTGRPVKAWVADGAVYFSLERGRPGH